MAVVSEGVPEEVVADGFNGLRAPFADPESLARQMARILQSSELHASLSLSATAHARSFSKVRVQESLRTVLDQALSGYRKMAEGVSLRESQP